MTEFVEAFNAAPLGRQIWFCVVFSSPFVFLMLVGLIDSLGE